MKLASILLFANILGSIIFHEKKISNSCFFVNSSSPPKIAFGKTASPLLILPTRFAEIQRTFGAPQELQEGQRRQDRHASFILLRLGIMRKNKGEFLDLRWPLLPKMAIFLVLARKGLVTRKIARQKHKSRPKSTNQIYSSSSESFKRVCRRHLEG